MIEVFADVLCPFTHVGLRRLVERREAAGGGPMLRVRAWPLELVNGSPLDGSFVAEEVEELRAQVAPDLFTGFRADRFPTTTQGAFALAHAASRRSDQLGEDVALALRHSLFEEGVDIGDPAALEQLADRFGVAVTAEDRASWEVDLAEGRTRGVVGSPHYFVGDDGWFCPALDISRVDGHLRIQLDRTGFDRFAQRALGAG